MSIYDESLFIFLLSAVASVIVTDSIDNTQQRSSFTEVVNHAFCESSLPTADKMGKNTLEEVHTYAELKHDPRASLPDSFTVCSNMMITNCHSFHYPIFFNILDDQGGQLLSPWLGYGSLEGILGMQTGAKRESVTGKIPPVFPNQWIRSCMAINVTSHIVYYVN